MSERPPAHPPVELHAEKKNWWLISGMFIFAVWLLAPGKDEW